jgi:N6-adenosine-specific RNA methylase IME4
MTRYRTIVADPPWQYEGFIPGHTPSSGVQHPSALPYSMLSVPEICALPVKDLAASDARLFLWTTNRYLRAAFDVTEAWGFRYRQTVVWHKTGRVPAIGGSIAPNHAEFLLVAVKGQPGTNERWRSNVLSLARLAHSQKPEAFLDLIERVSPGPYVELFARRDRLGWETWGNEALGTAELAA